jgi:alpha-tubulin suppressor-like RCC1 family protein
MDLAAGCRTGGSQRRGLALIVGAVICALTVAIASPAQAHTPYTGKAWGLNTHGELGDGSIGGPEECTPFKEACSTSPLTISGLSGVRKVSGGSTHALALLEGGTVVAWGANGSGQLGDGNHEPSGVPVAVCEVGYTGPTPCPSGHLLTGVTNVAAGSEFSLATLANGTVVAWGEIVFAQLGDGATKQSDFPVAVCEIGYSGPVPCPSEHYLKGATAVAAGERFALARLESGKVAAWGQNTLGNGSEAGSNVPVEVSGLSGVTAIAARKVDGYALSGGKVMAWGNNGSGQLGNGTEASSNVPVEVSGLSGVTAIAAGIRHALALLKSSGKVMAWGENDSGELGDETSTGPEMCGVPPTTPCAKKPVEVSGLSGISALSAGLSFSLALRGDRTLAAWGSNSVGELGTGSSLGPEVCGSSFGPCSTKPVEVSKLADAKGIGAGDSSSYAFGPPPTVTKVKPKQGPVNGGTTVTITGTDFFAGTTAVKFGSTNASSFNVESETSITAVSPEEPAGTVDVTVTTGWGTSAISLADHFKFAPTVTNVSPNTGSTAGGTTVTVTGAGFVAGTTATKFRFGTALGKSVNCASTTTCKVASPAHAAGTVDVKATVNKVSSAKKAPADQYTYS